ncbi:hypothetical protein Acidovoranil_28170 [Acidovorax sp. FG27]
MCEGYATGWSIELAVRQMQLNTAVLVCFPQRRGLLIAAGKGAAFIGCHIYQLRSDWDGCPKPRTFAAADIEQRAQHLPPHQGAEAEHARREGCGGARLGRSAC